MPDSINIFISFVWQCEHCINFLEEEIQTLLYCKQQTHENKCECAKNVAQYVIPT